MARTKGTYSVTSNFEPKVGAPLDARTVVKLTADLTAVGTFSYPYEGMTVYCEEDETKYTLIGADPTVEENWRPEIVDASAFQTKTMSESVVVDEETKTTVEGSIGGFADLLNSLGLCVRDGKVCQKVDTDILDVWGFVEHQDILNPALRIEYIGKNANYTPITINAGTGSANMGSWGEFPVIVSNKPYMVKADGTADYQLSESDYTKKADGVTASDVSNSSYAGAGAFAWIKKMYRWQYELGNDIYTFFSTTKKNANYLPDGFLDPEGNELEGIWIPMFYGAEFTSNDITKLMSIGTGTAAQSKSTAQLKTEIENVSSRGKFLGGPIFQFLDSILVMFAKSTDLQGVYGYGNRNNGGAANMKANTPTGGGKFYGTFDSKSINKILHSMVLATYNQLQRDPYIINHYGRIYVSKNYIYDTTTALLTDTGYTYSQSGGYYFPDKNKVVPGYGLIPIQPCNGSKTTGNCGAIYTILNATGIEGLRLASGSNNGQSGFRMMQINWNGSRTSWDYGASPIILPPVNYDPESEG